MRRHATNPWVVLVLICLAQFMVVLDATIVNVALPSIQKDLHLSEGNLQWIVNAYTLVFGGFLLLGGRAGDLLGRKRLFLIGLVLGGVLTQYFSWPWIFFVNVPVGIAVFLLSLRIIPESRDALEQRSYDLAGAVTVTGGLMALVYAIVDAQSAGWGSAKTLGFFAVALALLTTFVAAELRTAAPLVR